MWVRIAVTYFGLFEKVNKQKNEVMKIGSIQRSDLHTVVNFNIFVLYIYVLLISRHGLTWLAHIKNKDACEFIILQAIIHAPTHTRRSYRRRG